MAVDEDGVQGDDVDLEPIEAVGEGTDWDTATVAPSAHEALGAPGSHAAASHEPGEGAESDAGRAFAEPVANWKQRPTDPRPSAEARAPVQRARFAPLTEEPEVSAGPSNIDLLLDVNLRVSVELGRATLSVRETLNLAPGSVVELDKLAGDPVDILVNGRLIAKGEVVVVDDQFGVRITEIASPRQRVEAMR